MQCFSFSSRDLPEKDVIEAARVTFSSLTNLEIDPLDQSFVVDMSGLLLPGLAIVEVASSAVATRRTTRLVADGNDDLYLYTARAGRTILRHAGGDDLYLHPGETFLGPQDCTGEAVHDQGARGLGIAIPRASLMPRLEGNDFGRVQKLPPTPELHLFVHYAQGLINAQGTPASVMARLAATHLNDLATLVLGAKRDDAHLAQRRGLRAARYQAVSTDILTNLANPELSLDWLAARHRISRPYLRALFYGAHTSFSDFLRNARLDKARDLLTDRRFMNRTITAIAAEVGFGDLSWFNNAFRRRFGRTPSDLRATAREDNGKR